MPAPGGAGTGGPATGLCYFDGSFHYDAGSVYMGAAWAFNARGNGYATSYPDDYYINCYLYALGVTTKPSKKNDSITNSFFHGVSMSDFINTVLNDVQSRGRSIRQISGPTASISSAEYRMCMRIGDYDLFSCDYHFWIQTSTGEWANKHGWYNAAVLEGYQNPSSPSSNCTGWDYGANKNFYNSSTIYFAVHY